MKPLDTETSQSLVRSERGSAFIQALVAIGIVGAMIYYLSPTVIKHRQQVSKTASIITTRLALHSMLDFTLLGVKQRWCFSDSWMPENCGKSTPATTSELLSHPRSVERLLMKQETVDFLKATGYGNAAAAPIDKIAARISINSFSALHPVYKIIADLKGYKVSAFDITIERDKRALIPEYGRETYVKVTVQLLDDAGKVIEVAGSKLIATSFVGVYPREVGSFALLVAGDMRLDQATSVSPVVGDVAFKMFNSKAQAGQYPGLVFDSPVYVNGSIYLPNPADKSATDSMYSPVTFNEKVIMGEGPIMRSQKEFRPSSAGGATDQFWSNISEFGGFLKGVDVDGGRDGGLDNLSGKTAQQTVDKTLMKQCIDRTLAMTSLKQTQDSILTGVLTKKSGSNFDYRLGLTKQNQFSVQRGEAQAPYAARGALADSSMSANTGAIANFKLVLAPLSANGWNTTLEVNGDIPNNGSVTLEPKVDLSKLKDSLNKQLSNAQEDRDRLNTELNALDARIADAERDFERSRDALEAARAQSPPDKRRIADLEAEVESDRNRVERRKAEKAAKDREMDAIKANLVALQDKLSKAESDEKVQPKITISMDAPDPENTNPTFKDLHIQIEHPEMLVNSMGEPLDMSLKLQAYDVSFDRRSSLRPSMFQKTNGYLNFKYQGGDYVPFDSVSDYSGTSKGSLPLGDINQNLEKLCAIQGLNGSTAFGGTDWGTSFTGSSRNSWAFTDAYDDRKDIIFDNTNASRANGSVNFEVHSIARTCIIKSSADFVTGFLTCEKLRIESRSTPLRIIASIIVSQGVEIDDSAYKSGIRWSTIYHPQATFELRQAGVLKGQNNVDCTSINRFPVWHPSPSITDLSNLYRCNAISLRSKADPFRWTTVDPDCGAVPGVSSHLCKNRMVRFYVLEVARESGI
ncbi:hypothetical protein [Bdellovibrio sp. NC01]|uniref:hypothetical protein n=1 Tax=Bdellovibrio sp. NC01 TaxID=2220073 RepID=UPI00115772E5|nr:hypothetical protein [Bdellovibrio sp. NC01]QDK38511.1 hypothetical protein DOE51_13465 [Bdellovibrio sp. NC01]